MGDKQQKMQPVRHDYLPKAGPKSGGQRKPSKAGRQSEQRKPLFEAIREDKYTAIKERVALAEQNRRERELDIFVFKTRQAEIAKTHSQVTKLKSGSLAHKVAMDLLDRFPIAVKTSTKSVTQVAEDEVLMDLDDDVVLRNQKAIAFGLSCAKRALHESFALAKSDASSPETVETNEIVAIETEPMLVTA